jgi:2,3,4,5-tetrahydropyridine-2-carboxylate N-succinyltransferase
MGVNQWLKKAVLLSFRLNDNVVDGAGGAPGVRQGAQQVRRLGRCRLPRRRFPRGARRRGARGAHIAKNVVLMPSFVNIGAFVDEGTMVDTWATVGSCAQIGKNVHISGGVGIGGVLEPLQAGPVIIEDGAFIARVRKWPKA